jgi:hypothetical protein
MWSPIGAPLASTGKTEEKPRMNCWFCHFGDPLVDAALEQLAPRTGIDDRGAERLEVVDRRVDQIDRFGVRRS